MNPLLLTFVLAFFLSPLALAAEKSWSASASTGIASNLYKFGNDERTTDSEFSLAPAYAFNEKWSAGFNFSVAKSLTGTREALVNDGYLTLNYAGAPVAPFANWSLATSLTAPLSKQSQKIDSLYTAITLTPTIAFDLKAWGLEKLTPSYSLALTRAFHQYYTSTEGESKKQYNVKNQVGLAYHFNDAWDVEGYYAISNSWTYRGTPSSSFGLGQALAHKISPTLSCSVGHENGGSTLKSNGQDSNISFVNPDSSRIYAELTYQF